MGANIARVLVTVTCHGELSHAFNGDSDVGGTDRLARTWGEPLTSIASPARSVHCVWHRMFVAG